MNRWMMFLLLISSCPLLAVNEFKAEQLSLNPNQLEFKLQELNSPWHVYPCEVKADPRLPHEYDISCQENRRWRNFRVHLVVSYYPKSAYGASAYEVLYWITDRTDERIRVYDSMTFWIHQNKAGVKANRLSASVGVDNDMNGLYLDIAL